ncbi:MAG: contractile injection system protein, VgrG/Pvc8 family [Pseudomonadota bacterium]
MRPVFAILADGADVTAAINSRLVSLTVTDVVGSEVDTCELVVDDRNGEVVPPPHQAQLTVSMGFAERGLVELGTFLVDETRSSGPPATLAISASAADMNGGIRAPRTKSWEAKSVGDMVREIAGDHGLEAAVAERLDGITLPFVAQSAESDLNFLERLARQYNFRFAPKSGRLVALERSSDTLPDGTATPEVALDRGDLRSWDLGLPDRGRYGRIKVRWQNVGTGTTEVITVGEDLPERELRHIYDSAEAAAQAATAALQSAQTSTAAGKLNLATFRGDIFAGSRVRLTNFQAALVGPYTVTRVEHRLSTEFTTTLDLEALP